MYIIGIPSVFIRINNLLYISSTYGNIAYLAD